MRRESLIFFLGFVSILLPFLGVPSMWKRIGSVVLGCVLVLVGYQLRRMTYLRAIEDHTGERKTDVYVEQAEQLFVEPSDHPDSRDTTRRESEKKSGEKSEVRPRRARTKNV